MPSTEGKHTFEINLKNLKGTGNINRLEFFIDNRNNGRVMLKINSITDYICELPYVSEVTENVEIGNFVHKNGDKYLFLVNRDTNNPVTVKIKLDSNSVEESYLLDILTGQKIYSEASDAYTFYYNLEPGDGRLLEIVPPSFFDEILAWFRNLLLKK